MHQPACLALLTLAILPTAHSQAAPTATLSTDLTLFAGATSNYTGLGHGHNASVTAGVDLNLHEFVRIRPSLEIRATIPYTRSTVDDEREILAGPRVEFRIDRLHPYVDLLLGRGSNTFTQPYSLPSGGYLYSQPRSTVIGPGIGARFELTPHIALFGDAQIQSWTTPASLSGHLFSKPLSAGLVYRFAFTNNGFPTR